MAVKKLIIKNFNLDVGDRVIVSPTAPMYGLNSFHPIGVQGTIVLIKPNSDAKGSNCPLYIVWDNDQLSANTLQDIKLVDHDRLKDRYTYNLNEIFFKDTVPAKLEDLLPMLYSGKYNSAIETYYKNEFGILSHCVPGKLRSFDDIYYLFTTYFPEETIESVFKRILLYGINETHITTNNMPFQLAECSTMRRIRYIPAGSNYRIQNMFSTAISSNKYDSIYSWRQLFAMIGIKNASELTAWYKLQFAPKIDVPLLDAV